MSNDELQLLNDLQAGDAAAFESFVNKIVPRWVRFFTSWKRPYRLTPDEVDDVIQDTLLVILKKISAFNPQGKARFSTWCYRIAILTARARQRERGKLTSIEDSGEVESFYAMPPGDELEESDILSEEDAFELLLKCSSRAQQALLSLTKLEQHVVLYRALWGLTHGEIAAKLGKSEGAVRVQFYRVKQKLEPLLEGLLRKTHAGQ